MILAIIGSRSRDSKADFEKVESMFNRLTGVTGIVSGGATQGGDRFAEVIAKKYSIPIKIHKADWKTHGKSAGMKRNVDIIRDADLVIACWDGESSGTRHSIGLARRAKKSLYRV